MPWAQNKITYSCHVLPSVDMKHQKVFCTSGKRVCFGAVIEGKPMVVTVFCFSRPWSLALLLCLCVAVGC